MGYMFGEGVPQDTREAVHWFRLAAEQGVTTAQAALALRYSKGEGVPQDLVEAYKWATIASKGAGDRNAGVPPAHLEDQMTAEQIAEGKRLASEFVPHRNGPAAL